MEKAILRSGFNQKLIARDTKVFVGCISWTYPDWIGSFYPPGSKSSDLLSLYSKVFDIVEIDSTFYRVPTASTINQWMKKTPQNFLFTAKLPRRVTHELRLKDVSGPLQAFESAVKGLGTKLACVMAQLPPNFKFEKGFDLLSKFLDSIGSDIRYAIEFRDASWFRAETYDLLRRNKVSLVWSINKTTGGRIDTQITSDFLYLRFMGEFREFTRFNRVQKEKTEVLSKAIASLEEASSSVDKIYALMSNHFEGFAPSTANSFKKLVSFPESNSSEKIE